MIGTFTLMGVLVLGTKLGLTVLSGAGIVTGMNWFNKKTFVPKEKKQQEHTEDHESPTEKFSMKKP